MPAMIATSATLKMPVRNRPDADVQEIDDAAEGDPIDQVRNAAGEKHDHADASPTSTIGYGGHPDRRQQQYRRSRIGTRPYEVEGASWRRRREIRQDFRDSRAGRYPRDTTSLGRLPGSLPRGASSRGRNPPSPRAGDRAARLSGNSSWDDLFGCREPKDSSTAYCRSGRSSGLSLSPAGVRAVFRTIASIE